jgi:cobalt-zinc-cadmium efflux system protein
VTEVHDLHLWQITSGQPALSARVLVEQTADCHAVRSSLQSVLAEAYHITHATLQVDHSDEPDSTETAAKHCADPNGLAPRRTICRA